MSSTETAQHPRHYRALSVGILYLYLVAFAHWFTIWQATRNVATNVVQATTNTPFDQAGPRFSDFYQILYASKVAHPYLFHATDYPQSALVVTRIFGLLPDDLAFVLFSSISFAFICSVIWSASNVPKITRLVLMLSFPVMFAIDRGNLDLLAVALILLALSCSEIRPGLTGALLGAAIAIKAWPIIFVFAFVRHAKFKKLLAWSAMVAAGLMIIGIWSYGGSIFTAFSAGMSNVGSQELTHNSSLLALTALLGSISTGHGFTMAESLTKATFTLAPRLLVGLFLLISLIGQRRLSKRLLAASLFVLLIPTFSFEYRVSVMLVPLIAELTSSDFDEHVPKWWIVLSWILILGPAAIWYAPNSAIGTDSLIVPISLLVLGTTLFQPLSDLSFHREPSEIPVSSPLEDETQ